MLSASLATLLALAAPRFGVVLTLANDNRVLNRRSLELMRCRLRGVVASLRAVGWSDDIVCLLAGLREESHVFQTRCDHVLHVPVPAYDAGPPDADTNETIAFAHRHGRVPPLAASHVQQRRDGGLTSVKFHAWRLTQYDAILHTDVDVSFLESPRAALEAAHASGLLFQPASREAAKRGYVGINTHMMLLRPSLDMHALITANAASGHFIPYTRTEQDVLEALFPLRGVVQREVPLSVAQPPALAASATGEAAHPRQLAAAEQERRARGSSRRRADADDDVVVPMPLHLHHFDSGCDQPGSTGAHPAPRTHAHSTFHSRTVHSQCSVMRPLTA